MIQAQKLSLVIVKDFILAINISFANKMHISLLIIPMHCYIELGNIRPNHTFEAEVVTSYVQTCLC